MRRNAVSIGCLLVLLFAVELTADDKKKPPLASGSTPNAPSGDPAPPPGGSASTSTQGGSHDPGLFADIAGSSAMTLYCIAGEPCAVVRQFNNRGAAASGPIPATTWSVNNTPTTPASIQQQQGGSNSSWPAGETRKWLARFTLPPGDFVVRATMPRLPNEKEEGNNVASGQVIVGRPDMSIKLERDNVDYNTRYEIKAEIENKGTVPTHALSVLVVLSVNTHTDTPPTLDQCVMNPTLSGCVIERHSVDKLDPGEKKRWKIGPKQLASTNVAARAQVGCADPGPCVDSDPENNTKNKRFGP